jgi:hypothetical protein
MFAIFVTQASSLIEYHLFALGGQTAENINNQLINGT